MFIIIYYITNVMRTVIDLTVEGRGTTRVSLIMLREAKSTELSLKYVLTGTKSLGIV